MNQITEKPDWNAKVFDDSIATKWKSEALAMENFDISEQMLDWVCRLPRTYEQQV
jgi:hypothetical protein